MLPTCTGGLPYVPPTGSERDQASRDLDLRALTCSSVSVAVHNCPAQSACARLVWPPVEVSARACPVARRVRSMATKVSTWLQHEMFNSDLSSCPASLG